MSLLHITRPFVTGRSQAVRIPKEYRFADNEELVLNRIGDSIMITPKSSLASAFFSGASLLDDDFMADGRPEEIPASRKAMDQDVYARYQYPDFRNASSKYTLWSYGCIPYR